MQCACWAMQQRDNGTHPHSLSPHPLHLIASSCVVPQAAYAAAGWSVLLAVLHLGTSDNPQLQLGVCRAAASLIATESARQSLLADPQVAYPNLTYSDLAYTTSTAVLQAQTKAQTPDPYPPPRPSPTLRHRY